MAIKLFGSNVLSLPEQVEQNTIDIEVLKNSKLPDLSKYETKEDHETDIKDLKTELDTEINKIDNELKSYETIANHDSDIITLEKDISKLQSQIPIFDEKSITKTSGPLFTQAITKAGVSDYITYDDIKKLIDVKSFSWIPGEYKYLKKGVNMPDGWVKLLKPENIILSSGNINKEYNNHIIFSAQSSSSSWLAVRPNDDNTVSLAFENVNGKDAIPEFTYNILNCDLWIYDPEKKYTTFV